MKSFFSTISKSESWLSSRPGMMTTTFVCSLISLYLRWDFAIEEHPPSHYLMGDMQIYANQAEHIFHTRDAWDTFTPPGYPAFLALVGDIEKIGAAQAILGALTTALTMFLARKLNASPWTNLLAGIASAFYFPLIFYNGFVLSESLFAFLLLVFIAAFTRAQTLHNRWLALGSGVILAAAILVRPSLLTFFPFLLYLAWRDEHPRIPRYTLLGALLALAPITIHTSYLLGRPAVVASNGGVNFFLANSECKSVRSTIEGRIMGVSTHYTRTHYAQECVIDRSFLDEPWLYRAGLSHLMQHPGHVWTLVDGLREGLGLVPYRPWPNQPYWPGSTEYGDRLNAFSRGYFWLLLLPASAHFFLRRKSHNGPEEKHLAWRLSWTLLVSVFIAILIYNGNPRVRVSSDPIAIALSSSAIVTGMRVVKRRLTRRT